METDRRSGRLDTILKFAEKRGYKSVKYRCEWKKYKVYEMIMENKKAYIGFPTFLIATDTAFRIATDKETLLILDHIAEVEK